ncbi:hypothetical protein MNB_SM-4-1784 [hydrothermal vent metagenome]|uniref:Uncharacterized protein n=1 Tax=hydrothermal vent metagenome TaxID=652676 RepID=A0A1W1C9T1_9ZZZZ
MIHLTFKSLATLLILNLFISCNSSDSQSTQEKPLVAETLKSVTLVALTNEKESIQLHGEGATRYTIKNLPSWISLDENSGLVTLDGENSHYGQEYFDVTISNTTESFTKKDALKIQLFRKQEFIGGKLRRNKITPTVVESSLKSISGTGAPLVYDKKNNYWKAIVTYYTSYSNNNHLKLLNLTTLKEDKSYDKFLEGTPLNGVSPVVAYDLDTYIRISGKFVKYSNDTQEITEIGDVPSSLGRSILYPSITLGLDGQLVMGGALNGKISIAEYNITSKSYTVWSGLNVDAEHPNGDNAANRNAAADATHLYASTNGNGTGYRVYSMDRATKTGKKLANCPGWVTVAQGKYGAWVYMPSNSTDANNEPLAGGMYWLDKGKLLYASNGLNQDTCPWDNHGEEFSRHTAAPIDRPYKVLGKGMIPKPSENTGAIWLKRLISSAWEKVTVANIQSFPIILESITAVDNKIISVGDAYAGFSVYDIDTQTKKNYTGLLSYYSDVVIDNKLYMSGYPSGMLYEYDPSLAWGNTAGSYDPNEVVNKEEKNPKFIGFTRYDSPNINGVSVGGTGGGQHKNFVLLEGNDNVLWAFGEWERDGHGLGVTSVDLNDNYRMKGYRDKALMEHHTPRDGVATEDYLVVLCEWRGDSFLDLSVMDKETKKFHNITLPPNAIMPWSSLTRGSTITNYGKNKVVIASANDKRELILIGVDIETDTILYNHTFLSSYTSSGGDMELMSDGNIYLGLNGITVLVEPNNGWIEEVHDFGMNGQRVLGPDDKLYYTYGTKTYRIDKPFLESGFKTISKNEGDIFNQIVYYNQGSGVGESQVIETTLSDGNISKKAINIQVTEVGNSDGELFLATKYNLNPGKEYTIRFNAKINSGTAKIIGYRTYNVKQYTPVSYTLKNGANEFVIQGDNSNKFPRFQLDNSKLFDIEISEFIFIDNLES